MEAVCQYIATLLKQKIEIEARLQLNHGDLQLLNIAKDCSYLLIAALHRLSKAPYIFKHGECTGFLGKICKFRVTIDKILTKSIPKINKTIKKLTVTAMTDEAISGPLQKSEQFLPDLLNSKNAGMQAEKMQKCTLEHYLTGLLH